ncbi:hypothetical protein LTR56_016822 [Elasticomyces elasticus]|nr:hypothetical protein LTR56_016822 [Elasticomyces elasticus]KAK3644515.1 hypothetical protein LTR22_015113 [Elasticomyces elasticus]KAK4921614.1 hypothetical protein LTR49_010900 [Elasticomyces elasticus]KAK5758558.1 hypothetical protein LTS12_011257 [Elasticomyces elasticus]
MDNQTYDREDSGTEDMFCSCRTATSIGGFGDNPCCVMTRKFQTRAFKLVLQQLRRDAKKLANNATPAPSGLPVEGELYHEEGQVLVDSFSKACEAGGCTPDERKKLYERCMMMGGLAEVMQRAKDKRELSFRNRLTLERKRRMAEFIDQEEVSDSEMEAGSVDSEERPAKRTKWTFAQEMQDTVRDV